MFLNRLTPIALLVAALDCSDTGASSGPLLSDAGHSDDVVSAGPSVHDSLSSQEAGSHREGGLEDASPPKDARNSPVSPPSDGGVDGRVTHPLLDGSLSGFVTREGTLLMLGGAPFRFSGPNVPNLADSYDWQKRGFPSTAEVDYLLDTTTLMGGRVIRSHGLGISVGHPGAIEPELGKFDETALKRVDYAIAAAGARGLRLIVPLSDNVPENVMGTQFVFSRWRGYAGNDKPSFFADAKVIADFKAYISTILTRVNTYTGVPYAQDPTILAWETGNELDHPPTEWTRAIADYIRSLDQNHLIMDGTQWFVDADLSIDSIDIYTQHYYGQGVDPVDNARRVTNAGKVFISGEYDWAGVGTGENLTAFTASLADIESERRVTGDLWWALYSPTPNCASCEGGGFNLAYPGDDAQRPRVSVLVNHAFRMAGNAPPAMLPAPVSYTP